MFNQREVFRGAEIRALVPTTCERRIWWESFSAHGDTKLICTVAAHGCLSGPDLGPWKSPGASKTDRLLTFETLSKLLDKFFLSQIA